MRKKRYKQRCGDFEIRILPDGRVVMLAPDDNLLEIAGELEPDSELLPHKTKEEKYARTQTTAAGRKT